MATLSEVQRKWVDGFLRKTSQVVATSPTIVQAARQVMPTAAPIVDVLMDNPRGVLMYGPVPKGASTGASTGDGSKSKSEGSSSTGSSGKPAVVPKGADTVGSGASSNSSSSAKPAVVPKGADTAGSNVSGGSSNSGGTVGTTGNPSSSGQGGQTNPATHGLATQTLGKNWPDSTVVTIQTVKGPEKMSVDDYRWKRYLAQNWVSEQMQHYQGQASRSGTGLKSGDLRAYEQEAAKRFGLDQAWANNRRVPGTNASVGLPYGTDPRLVPDHIKYGVPKAADPPARGGDQGHAKAGVDPYAKTGVDPQAKSGVDPQAKTHPAQPAAGALNEKAIAEMSAAAKEARKLAKSGNPTDSEKARQKLAAAEKQAEVVAKSIKPDVPGREPTTAKSLARDAKSAALKTSGIALKFLVAYAVIEDARRILDSKSVSEALEKTLQVAKGHAKEAVKIGALRFVTRSTPIAVGLSIILQTNEETDKQERARTFATYVATVMNQIRPGSAYLRRGNQSPEILDMELHAEVVRQVKAKRVEDVESGVVQIGYQDGLTGSPKKNKFEVSQADEEDLGISSKTMEAAYFRGHGQGERERIKVADRLRYEGYKDALEGKPSNFEAIEWPEIRELLSRLNNRNISNDEFREYQGRLTSYGDSYRDGYERGKKAATQRTLQRIDLLPAKGFSAKQYSSSLLRAFAVYSEGPVVEISNQDIWSSSDRTVVDIEKGGAVHAIMKGPGKATVTAKFQSNGAAKDAKLDITVEESKNKPRLNMYFLQGNGAYHVDEEVEMRAYISKGESPDVSLFWNDSKWTVEPKDAASISPAPDAEVLVVTALTGGEVIVKMLKEGKATITVTSTKDTTLMPAKTTVTVKPKK